MTSTQEDPDIESFSLEELLQLHLNLSKSACPWTVQSSPLHGQGLFAARRIEQGEIVFRDVALVLGPRSGLSGDPLCVACLSPTAPLRPCSKLCRLPVCSQQCENSPQHVPECDFLREYGDVRNTNNDERQPQRTHCPRMQDTIGRSLYVEEKKASGNERIPNSEEEAQDRLSNRDDGRGYRNTSETGGTDQNSSIHTEQGAAVSSHLLQNETTQHKCLEINNNCRTNFQQNEFNGPSQSNSKEICEDSSKQDRTRELQIKDESKSASGKLPTTPGGGKEKRPTLLEGVNIDLLRSVTPLRCLQMSKLKRRVMKFLESIEHPICEVDILKQHLSRRPPMEVEKYLRYCCGVLDTNAYGGTGHGRRLNFRGLYALSALMNHSCTPNTTYWFDSENRMVVKAARPIVLGEEILSTYTSLLWGSATRRSFLNNTKSFLCVCERCRDATEYGSYLSAIYCKSKPCRGLLVPSDPLKVKSDWICTSGSRQHRIGAQKAFQVLNICSKVAELLIQSEDVEQVRTFFKSIPDSCQSAVQIRKHFALHTKESIAETSAEKLQFREESCLKLLDLLTQLKLGDNYLRGLILQELFLLLQEKGRRVSNSHEDSQHLETIKTQFERILSS